MFKVKYFEENAFAEQKKLQVLNAKMDVMSKFKDDIASAENKNGLWSRKYVMTEIWGMTDQEYQEQQTMIQEELAETEAKEKAPKKSEKPSEEPPENEDGSEEAKSEVPVQELPNETPEETPATVGAGEGGTTEFPEP